MTGYASVDWSSAQVETARLLLRPLRPQDADLLFLDRDDAEPRFWQPLDGRDATGLRTAVVERASGRRDRRRRAVSRSRPGAGHGPESTSGSPAGRAAAGTGPRWSPACVPGRSGSRSSRVELLAGATDEPAHRVALAAGFRREGLLRSALPVGQARADAVVYGRLATDPATPPRRGLPDVGELTDGVVTVRPLRPGDEAALLEERLDPESQRWATSTRLWTAQDVRVFVAGTAAAWLSGTRPGSPSWTPRPGPAPGRSGCG